VREASIPTIREIHAALPNEMRLSCGAE
jgi:hypothetical protein